jgi:hypothetical protein
MLNRFTSVLQLLCFVLHVKSGQTALAALHEQGALDHKEEVDASIIQTDVIRKRRKVSKEERRGKMASRLGSFVSKAPALLKSTGIL